MQKIENINLPEKARNNKKKQKKTDKTKQKKQSSIYKNLNITETKNPKKFQKPNFFRLPCCRFCVFIVERI